MKPVTVIVSGDDFLAERALAPVRERLEAQGFQTEQFAAADERALLEALETPSLFGGGRLVLVRDAADLSADALSRVGRWAESGGGGAHLALMFPKAGKATKALAAHADVTTVAAPPPWEVPGWVSAWFKGHGRQISAEAAAALVEAVGTDLRELASAAEQLMTAAGAPVDVAAVHRLFRGAESQVWTFVDAVLERDRASALRHLRALLAQGENPIGLLSAIARQMRTVALVRGDRRPASAIAKEIGVKEGAVKRAFRQARGFDVADVRRAFRVLADADLSLKGGADGEGEPSELVLEMVVGRIAGDRA